MIKCFLSNLRLALNFPWIESFFNREQLISELDWQLYMGVEAMVEEKHNNYSDMGKVKINKEDLSKLKIPLLK